MYPPAHWPACDIALLHQNADIPSGDVEVEASGGQEQYYIMSALHFLAHVISCSAVVEASPTLEYE